MATNNSSSSTMSSNTALAPLSLNSDHSLNASQSSITGIDFSSGSVSHFLSIKLDRTNYPLWLAQISHFLKGRKLMGIADGTNLCPPCFLAGSDGKLSNTVNPNYENWIAQEQTLLNWINGSLTPSMLETVASSTSAFSTWKSLAKRYASKSQNRVLQLRSDLLRTFRGNLSITDYLDKINAIADNLALAGHPMSDEDLVSIIMNNVGPLYETTVSSAQALDTPITYDSLKALLLSAERSRLAADKNQGVLDISSQLTVLHVSAHSKRGRGPGRQQTTFFGGRNLNSNSGYGRSGTPTVFGGRGRGISSGGHSILGPHSSTTNSSSKKLSALTVYVSTPSSSTWLLNSGANSHGNSDLSNLQLPKDTLALTKLAV